MDAKHTPGPWGIDEHGHIFHRPAPLTKFVIAEMESGNEADERLIVAAPDLLAACKALYATHKPGKGQCCIAADMAVDAISKAEGK